MIKFDSNNVLVGYIKELLRSFNLPSCRIKSINDDDHLKGESYIDNNTIYMVDEEGNKKELDTYYFNAKLPLNLERHLVVKELYYDSYTHRYLGDYLRYLRDYMHLDLMSLYNCFDNNLINIYYKNGVKNFQFDSNDDSFKIYAIPVKFGKEYTIAIDCPGTAEMFCGLYDEVFYSDVDGCSQLHTDTYIEESGCMFNKPFIYNKLKKASITDDLLNHERDLRLFIKLPLLNNSSIVVLEGDYRRSAQNVSIGTDVRPSMRCPKIVRNYDLDIIKNLKKENIVLSTRSQLLEYNTHTSYPFADKLIGYLLDNTVTPLDTIGDNFKRIKKQILKMLKEIYGNKKLSDYIRLEVPELGWDDVYNIILSDHITNYSEKSYSNADNNLDVLGYYDKDIENLFDDIDIYGDMTWKESTK